MHTNEAIERVRSRFDKWALDKEDLTALQTLGLVDAESEDERIRKSLIEVFKKKLEKGFEWTEFGIPNRSVLDWLEKRKEQNVAPSRETILGIWELGNFWKENPEERDGLTQLQYIQKYWFEKCDYQKEQKPADNVSREEYVKRFKALCDAYEIKLPNREYDIYGLCDDLAKLFTDSGKQKPTNSEKPKEWSDDIIRKAVKEVGLTQHQIDWFKTNVFPPKQEWSEEDERIRQRLIKDIEFERNFTLGTTSKADKVIRKYNEQINLLKSLPERFNPQLKQEWSEEDEAAFGDLMWCIEQARKSAKDENDMGNIWFAENWLKNRLKSLLPQSISQPNTNHTVWHNASEEKPTRLPIIHIWYHGNRVNAVVAHENVSSLQAELDDINFQPDDKWAYVEDLLNVQPHWKPSKE